MSDDAPEVQLAVLVGLPAAGKTTFARNFQRDWCVFTVDDYAPDYRRFWAALELQAQLRRENPQHCRIMLDGAFVRGHARERAIGLFRPHVRAIAFVFEVPLEECLRRNAVRSNGYPDSEVRRKAEIAEPVQLSEGFAAIYRAFTTPEGLYGVTLFK